MAGDQQNFHQQAGEEAEEEEEEDLPGWGHWAMPAEDDEFIDQELEVGEFMELADLLQPLDEQHM